MSLNQALGATPTSLPQLMQQRQGLVQQEQAQMQPQIEKYNQLQSQPMPTPPDLPKTTPPPQQEDFGKESNGFLAAMAVLSTIAGARSRQHATTALNAFAAGVNGYKQGNQQAFENATKTWKESTDAAIQSAKELTDQYKEQLESRKDSQTEILNNLKLIGTANQDPLMANVDDMNIAAKIYEMRLSAQEKAQEHQDIMQMRLAQEKEKKEEPDKPTWTPETIEGEARYLAKTGKFSSNLGRLTSKDPNRVAALNRAFELNPQLDLAASEAAQAGRVSESRKEGGQAGSIEMAANLLDSSIPSLKAAAAKVHIGQFPDLNAIENYGLTHAGDKDFQNYRTQVRAVISDYSLLIGRGRQTVHSDEEAKRIFNENMGSGQLEGFTDAIQTEAENARKGVDKTQGTDSVKQAPSGVDPSFVGTHDSRGESIMADALTLDQQRALAMAAARKRASDSKPDNLSPNLNAVQRGAAERVLGGEELINNLGVGKHLGLPSNELIDSALAESDRQQEAAKASQGNWGATASRIGHFVGDPLTLAGGGEAKGAKGLYDLAKAGAKVGAGVGATDPAKDIKHNIEHAAVGAGLGAAAPGAAKVLAKGAGAAYQGAKTIGEGFSARSPEALQEAAAIMRKESSEAYTKMREMDARISPEAIKTLSNDVGQQLAKKGLLNPRLHGDTLSVLKQLQQASKNGISLEALDQHRRLLSGVINKNRVSNKEDAEMARTAISAIDEAVDKIKPDQLTNSKAAQELKTARATWAKARKFEMISDIVEKSEGDPNRMKTLLSQLANNDAKTRGFTMEEKNALKEASQNTTTEGLLKMAGKFGIKLGSGRAAATGNVLPALEVGVAGAKKGIPAVLGGTIAKYGQNQIAKAKTERLLKAIEKGKVSSDEAIGATRTLLPQIENQQKALP